MLRNLIIGVGVSLLIGGGIGYLIGSSKDHPDSQSSVESSDISGSTHDSNSDVLIQELKEESGSNRDALFLENMILHHQSAVEMSKVLLETTKRPELKKMAEEIIANQSSEIDTMKGWLSAWYGR